MFFNNRLSYWRFQGPYGVWSYRNLLEINEDTIASIKDGVIKFHKVMNSSWNSCSECSIFDEISDEDKNEFCSLCNSSIKETNYRLSLFMSSYIKNKILSDEFKIEVTNVINPIAV